MLIYKIIFLTLFLLFILNISKKFAILRDEVFSSHHKKITNIDNNGSFNLKFKETTYELSKFTSNISQSNKLGETETLSFYMAEPYIFKF